ncbi:unnamed protein product [Blepharisma stoltei]|uniref:RZ-type domain-containing protein n=1 Tax=Blepharisma stoltei TaxID=1481888 RepID=A0AAU9JGI3_9CILI|nr:unnamed protein product [Blepharisma stoltei]
MSSIKGREKSEEDKKKDETYEKKEEESSKSTSNYPKKEILSKSLQAQGSSSNPEIEMKSRNQILSSFTDIDSTDSLPNQISPESISSLQKFNYVYALCNLNSKNLTNCSLVFTRENKGNCEKFYMHNGYYEKFSPNIKIFTIPFLPRDRWDGRIKITLFSEDPKNKDIKVNVPIIDPIRTLNIHFQHIFLFGLKVASKPSKKSKTIPIDKFQTDPLQELSIYTDFLLRNQDWERRIPMLIEQFRAQYIIEITAFWENASIFFRIVEEFISENPSLSADQLHILISLISCVPHSMIQYKEVNFCQSSILLQNSENMQNLASSPHSLEGLVHLMIFNIKEKREDWMSILNYDLNDFLKFSILNHFLADLRLFKIYLRLEEKAFILEKISLYKFEEFLKLFRHLALSNWNLNCEDFLSNLQNIILKNDSDGQISECWKLLFEFCQTYIVSMNDVIDFFKAVSGLDQRFKCLTYIDNIKSIIWNVINQSNEKKEARMKSYHLIFKTYSDPFFSDYDYAVVLSEKLMKDFNTPLYEIWNVFGFKTSLIKLLDKWAESIALKDLKLNEIIYQFTKETLLIKDKENLGTICEVLIEKLLSICEKRKIEFLDCARYIDDSKNDLLNVVYIKAELEYENKKIMDNKISVSHQKYIVLEKFFKRHMKYPTNKILSTLIDNQLSSTEFEYTESELNTALFEKPEKQIIWSSILSSYEYYEPLIYSQFLIRKLSEIGNKLLEENIELHQIDIIKIQTASQRAAMINLLEKSFKFFIRRDQDFSFIIENIITKRNLIEKEFESFAKFTNHFQNIIEEYENIENACNAFKVEYTNTQLASFSFPNEMILIIGVSWKIGPAIDSFIFNNYYLAKYKSLLLPSSSIKIIVSTCEDAHQKMINNLTELFRDTNAYPMKEIVKLFSNLRSIEDEIMLLSLLVPLDEENKNILIKCLHNYQEHETLMKACHGLMKLKEIAVEADRNALEACSKYIEFSSELENSNIGEYLNISERVHELFDRSLSRQSKDCIISTLQEIGKSKELVLFLLDLRKDEIDQIRVGVSNFENEFVDTKTISDLENLWYCIGDIKRSCSNFFNLCNLFELNRDDGKKFMEVPQQLQICSPNLRAITELHTEVNCKEEAKKKHISEISKNSIFIIKFENDKFDIHLRYPSSQKVFDIATLSELKSRAQLIMHTSHSFGDPEDENLKYFPVFVDYVNSINSIIICMNDLHQNGYPDLEKTIGREFQCNDGKYDTVKEYEDEVLDLFKVWEIDLSDAYSKCYWLTFLCGKQFWTIEDYIIDPNCEKMSEAKNILRFMGKQSEIRYRQEYIKDGMPGDRLVKLGEILKKTGNLERNTYILGEKLNSQDKIIFLSTNKYLNGIFSIYKCYTGFFPEASQVLFCKSSTYWRELKAFLYRYFKDPYDNFYSLINCENLSLENQIKFKTLFNELLGSGHIKSGLAIITANSKCYLSQYFKSLTVPKVARFSTNQFLHDEDITKLIKNIDLKSYVITSSHAGLGKTTHMRYQAMTNSLNLVTFPIGGDINYSEVCEMISKISFVPESCILHLNLSYTSNPALLNEILINICLFRTLCSSENILVLNRFTPIWIEAANTFGNSLFKTVEYLSFVNLFHLDQFYISDLIVPENIDHPMQVVGRYLRLYDSQLLDDEKSVEDKRIVPSDEVKRLFLRYFIEEQSKKEQVTYAQLHIFISILNRLLKKFEISPFSPEMIKNYKDNLKKSALKSIADEYTHMRTMIFEWILESTKEFTTKCISNVKEIQEKSSEKISQNEIDELHEISSLVSRYQSNIKWESSNHFHLIFLDDGSFIPIYRDRDLVPRNFQKLLFLQSNYEIPGPELAKMIKKNRFKIDDYSSMTHVQLLDKLSSYNKDRVDLGTLYKKDSYVMTPDNFLKMNLIYLRVYSGLPVIIMGETGCGKTSLIQFLVKKVLGKPIATKSEETKNEETHLFAKISIHAGITSEDIRKEMRKLIDRSRRIDSNEKLWVFFDEFNTTDSIGMICEIMCERTLDGNPLPPNIAFLGACNPYRVSSNKNILENVGIQKERRMQNESKLVHVVKPLPGTMIDYVWDFGTLTHENVRIYISTMLDKIKSQHKEIFVSMICLAHKHFQEEEDVSSVSLRDVSRFVDLYLWFKKSIYDRCTESAEIYRGSIRYEGTFREIELSAGILAFSLCYYLRIASHIYREKFLHKIVDSLRRPDLINIQKIKEIIEIEQNDFVSRMELPKGTALNNALKENIFAAIPCIVNKIPLFICGKPGSSKSLSVQLIFSNLTGKKSNDPYFRTLPELKMVHFQGSETCKSESIIKVFENAERYPKINHGVLAVIVFDEIGLAELSKRNPLKVLHNYLEKKNINVGFIGISNWRLDASKMNRALYLARPDPDEKDLELTALSIYKSYTENKTYEHVISKLTMAYAGLKNQTKETEIANFYGLRDFYHLIKNVSLNLSKKDVSTSQYTLKCVKTAIERNFGGTRHGTAIMCSLFNEYYKINLPETNARTLDLIKDNLNDPNARYLMLIGKPDIATFILDKYLDKLNDRRILVGSSLPNDLNQDNYGVESLNDIIIYMELGISIVLKDLDHIYSSLYDLFNQNFSIQGSRKYCNISIEDNFTPRCYVNQNFHAIALISPSDVAKTDAPFLNRFEKHYLSIDKLLNDKQIDLLEKLESWIDSFFTINDQEIVSLTKNHLFPIYSSDTLALLILFNSQGKKKHTLEKCGEILLEIAPSDILILLELISIDPGIKENIKNTWKKLHEINFQDTIKSMIDDKSDFDKLIAFTYDKKISEKIFNTNDDEKIIIKEMVMYSSKKDLTKELKSFYKSEEKNVFVLEVDFGEECNHLPLVKFLIDKLNTENPSLKKKFCIVIHIKRNIKYSSNMMIFEWWKMKMFDCLTTCPFEITDEIILSNSKSLIMSDHIFDFSKEIEYLVEKCMLSFKVEINAGKSYEFNNYITNTVKTIGTDPDISAHFKDKIWKYLKTVNIKQDWRIEIFLNPKLIDDSANLYEAISKSLGMEIESALQLIIYVLEEKSALLSYVQPFIKPYCKFNDLRKQIWLDIFKSMTIDNNIGLQKLNQGNLLKYEYELYFPFSRMDYKAVIAAFNLYKISEVNNNPIQTSFEKFTEEYHKFSIYKEKIDFNIEHSELQDLYFNDLISIYLKENLLSLDHKKMISILLKIIFYDDDSFEKKLISFMQIEELGVLLCHAIDVMPDLSGEVVSILENILLNIDSFPMDQEENEDENQQKWKIALNLVYKKLICEMRPHLDNNLEFDVLEYSIKAENLYYLLTEIELKEDISIDTLDILEFWVSYSKLIGKSDENKVDILNILNQIKAIGNKEEDTFLYNENFARYILENVKNHYRNSLQYHKFMSSFLKLQINIDPQYIVNIAEELENEEFWQFSTKIMNIIEDKSEIENSMHELRKNILNNFNADFELENNDYLEGIEKVLENKGICSKFGIIFGDSLEKLLKSEENNKFYKEGLRDFTFFEYFLNKARYDEINLPRIKKLISLILVKIYLDIYCCALAQKLDEDFEILENIDRIITKSDIGDTLKLYCIKKILLIKGYELSNFILEYPNLNWTRRIKELEEEKKPQIKLNLDSFLVFPRISEIYKNNVRLLRNILNKAGDQNENDRILIEIQSPDQKLALGIAFLNEIFSIYSKEKEMNKNIIIWLGRKGDEILNSLGKEFYNIFVCFINNFPIGSDLRLETNTPDIELHRILTTLGVFTVALSYSQLENPISSVFFNENGSVDGLIERFKSQYIFAAEPNQLHKYIQDIHNNFDSFITNTWSKKYANGSTYKCSIDCDYIYPVTRCGGPTQQSLCPFCGRKIGGSRHKLVEREGHVNLSDREAREFVEKAVLRHRKEAETGLSFFGTLIGETSSIRGLNPASYLAEHFVLCSIIFVLHQLGSINEKELETLINSSHLHESSSKCLRRSIKSDYEKLLELSHSDSGYLWVYKILANLDELILENNVGSKSSTIRDEFEKRFENKLISPNLNSQNSIADYSNYLKKNFEIEYSFKDYLYEFFNLTEDKNYPYIELFRNKEEPSLENMKNRFLLGQSPNEFRLINAFLNNSDEIGKIESLYPIIEFTNSLFDIYNHKILRAGAYKITVGEAINSNPEIQPLFTKFLEAWKYKGIKYLHYGCKELKPINEFTIDTPLAYFLVDNKVMDGGMYMAAALIELGEIQNKYLSQIRTVISNNFRNKETPQGEEENHKEVAKYPLQKLKEQNIISLNIDDTHLLETCSLCNPIYGKGKEIIYDFERMQKLITKKLLLAKLIDTSRLDLIQYQGELINITSEESGLLMEIKEIIPQKSLEQEQLHHVELFFSELEKEAKMDYAIKLKDIYTSFNRVLCYLRYSKRENNCSVIDFCTKLNSLRISTYLRDRTRISEIKLEYVISLYQIVEAKYFPFTKGFINPEYKLTEKANIVEDSIIELIKKVDINPDLYPSRLQIEEALMRFIIRNSTANLNPEDKLNTYIVRYDFWDLNVDQGKIDSLGEIFPISIEISHSLNAYEFFYAKNHNINSRKAEVLHQEPSAVKKKVSKPQKNWKKGRD